MVVVVVVVMMMMMTMMRMVVVVVVMMVMVMILMKMMMMMIRRRMMMMTLWVTGRCGRWRSWRRTRGAAWTSPPRDPAWARSVSAASARMSSV
jgi:hypothetical protein